MHYKLAQLSLDATQKNDSVGEIFVAQTDLNKEALLGKLFIIVENHSRLPSDYKFVNFLLTEINKNYYQNDKAIMRERLKSISIEQVFESCLAKTNKALYDQLASHKLEINFNKLNVTIGVIHDTEVHFTGIGKQRLFLIYKNKKLNTDEYAIKEIEASSEPEHGIVQSKIFANLMNGQLPVGGFLFFTNEALPEYIGTRQIAEIISTLPPNGALEQIKNKLEQVNTFISFYAILIKSNIGLITAEPPKRRSSNESNKSIQNLRTTEAQTEKLLTPTGLIDFRNWFSRGRHALSFSKSQSNRLIMASRTAIKEKLPARKRLGQITLTNYWHRVQQFFIGLIGLALNSFTVIKRLFRRDTLLDLGQKSTEQTLRLVLKPSNWFSALTKKQKIYITVSVACVLLFFGNIYLLNYRNQVKQSAEFYNSTLAQIEQKENQIEANLIPRNFTGAKALATEIHTLINQLPAGKPPDAQLTKLKNQLTALEKTIRQETETETKEIANLKNFSTNSQPENLTLYKNKLFLGDTTNKTIYQIDLGSKVINSFNKSLDQVSNLRSTALENNLLYFWNNGSIFIYNLDKLEGKPYAIKGFSYTDSNIQLGIFAGRAYLTSPKDQQIYRLNYASNAFDTPRVWLKNTVDLSNLKQFYLDGNAYLLYNNNRLVKFARGINQNWSLQAVDPALNNISCLTTGDKFVYLADPINKRIVVVDNAGKIQNQLKNDLLTNISAMVADEAHKILYVMSGQKVYTVKLKD
jgi:hypothetical protein